MPHTNTTIKKNSEPTAKLAPPVKKRASPAKKDASEWQMQLPSLKGRLCGLAGLLRISRRRARGVLQNGNLKKIRIAYRNQVPKDEEDEEEDKEPFPFDSEAKVSVKPGGERIWRESMHKQTNTSAYYGKLTFIQ